MTLDLVFKHQLQEDPTSPLIYLVHGRAGTVDVMWTFKSYFPKNCSIVSMQAPLEDPIGGFSWWHLHNSKTNFEEIQSGVQKLETFVNHFPLEYKIKPRKVFGVGFSQGAASLSYLIQKNPSMFNAVGLLAGFVIEDRDSLFNNQFESKPSVFMAHGTKDDVVSLERAEKGRDYLKNKGYDVSFMTDEVTHKVGTGGMRGLRDFLSGFA